MKNSTAFFVNVAVTTLMLLLLYASVAAIMCEYCCYAPTMCKCYCCCCMLPLCANVAAAMSKHCCYYGTALRQRRTRCSSLAHTQLEPSSLQLESRSTLGLQQ